MNNKLNFVQIGANVGNTDNDPIYNKIINNNWKGILVEPNPKSFNKLKETYKDIDRLIFSDYAIMDYDGKTLLYVDNWNIDNNGKGEGTSQWSTCSKSQMIDVFNVEENRLTEVECNCLTLNSFFDLYKINDTEIENLIIDTEGYDGKILLKTDFNKIIVKSITFEFIHIKNELTEVTEYLNNNNYIKTGQTQEDLIFTKGIK